MFYFKIINLWHFYFLLSSRKQNIENTLNSLPPFPSLFTSQHLITGFPEAKLIKGNELRRGDYLFSCSLADCSSRQKRVTESAALNMHRNSPAPPVSTRLKASISSTSQSDRICWFCIFISVCAHANIVPLLTYSGNLVISDAHRLNGTRPALPDTR